MFPWVSDCSQCLSSGPTLERPELAAAHATATRAAAPTNKISAFLIISPLGFRMGPHADRLLRLRGEALRAIAPGQLELLCLPERAAVNLRARARARAGVFVGAVEVAPGKCVPGGGEDEGSGVSRGGRHSARRRARAVDRGADRR